MADEAVARRGGKARHEEPRKVHFWEHIVTFSKCYGLLLDASDAGKEAESCVYLQSGARCTRWKDGMILTTFCSFLRYARSYDRTG